jgi:orotidine-5'-phosphate decarboxylase
MRTESLRTEDRPPTKFQESLASAASQKRSNTILALDLDFQEDTSSMLDEALRIFNDTKDYLCGVKINFHLLFSLSGEQIEQLNEEITKSGIPSIADIKLNDIDNTNRVATEYLWKRGFSAVIVNPFVGYEGGLDVVFKRAKELDKGIITLAYMSHKGADEGYGLELKDGRTVFELLLGRAVQWQADGIIMGTTRTDRIAYARRKIPGYMAILSPGSGSQGGMSRESYLAGSDYLIYGRSIVEARSPRDSARQIFDTMLPLIEKGRRHGEHS